MFDINKIKRYYGLSCLLVLLSMVIFSYGNLVIAGNADKDGKKSNRKEKRVKVFPNPVKAGDDFRIEYLLEETQNLYVIITDSEGNPSFFFTEKFDAGLNNIVFNTTGLEPGKYTISINADNHSDKVKLFVVD